jgi:DNA polymerase-4
MFLHLDLDCFFASAHRINTDKYTNIPIAVGGRSNLSIFNSKKESRIISKIDGAFSSSILSSNKNKTFDDYFKDNNGKIRGIITTSSYEARSYGVKTAMSISQAFSLCPNLIVLPPNYPLYHNLSYKLKILLEKEIPYVQQGSIDEFYGDVSAWIEDKDILNFAIHLKEKIKNELGLPISIGISHTKYIAKLATNHAKPFGIKIVTKDQREDFIRDLPIASFPGIGRNYEKKLFKFGIKKLGEIHKHKQLFYSWKKPGIELYNRICGLDNDKIEKQDKKQSIGISRTFDPLINREEIKRRISILCRHLSFLCEKKAYSPNTYFLKIRYQSSIKAKDYINTNRIFNELLLKQTLDDLFVKIDNHPSHGIIQISVILSNFSSNNTSVNMFHLEDDLKQKKLNSKIHTLRNKFGIDIIKSANEL